jgi:hypothetical protein
MTDESDLRVMQERNYRFRDGIVLVPAAVPGSRGPRVYDFNRVLAGAMSLDRLDHEIAIASNRLTALVAARNWLAEVTPIRKKKSK